MDEDLEIDFKEKFGSDAWDEFLPVLEYLEETAFEDIEKDGYSISCTREKVNSLQENVCVQINRGNDMSICLMYENGISNGTQLNEYSLDGTDLSITKRYYEITVDVKVDYATMDAKGISYSKEKAEILLSNSKARIMELARKQSYDNHVTGGGTIKTDDYYANERRKLNDLGLYWSYVFKREAVMADFN